tara:strand:+ start:1593 stop:1850 length:258 start_codon:yes stop_codon:yes gene_type:complete
MENNQMPNRNRRLLEELDSISLPRDKVHLIESRAQHIIAGATNLVNLIKETYDEGIAEEMERKLLLAIKRQDPNKFNNGLKKLKK